MKILHLLRSKPTDFVRMLINQISGVERATEISLYDKNVDYDKLLQVIFENEKIISWW